MKEQLQHAGPLKPKRPAPTTVKTVRDNVLGRRHSKSDPLGRGQPGTLGKNAESLRATPQDVHDPQA